MFRKILSILFFTASFSISGCVSAESGQSYKEMSFSDAAAQHGFSYHLNVLSNLGMMKVCVPRETSLGELKDVSVEFNDEFKTAAMPLRKGELFYEYLFSLSVEGGFPRLDISAMYSKDSGSSELVVVAKRIGSSDWFVDDEDPVAEITCE